jgi:hypothetical protein
MLIGDKKTKKIFCLICLLICSFAEAQSDDGAWWLNAKFEPSVQISSINTLESKRMWAAETVLTNKLVESQVPPTGLVEYKKIQLFFTLKAIRGSNKIKFQVGTFKNEENVKGKFLKIFKNNQVIRIFEDKSGAGFSALKVVDGSLRWYKCIYCNEFDTVIFRNGQFFLN